MKHVGMIWGVLLLGVGGCRMGVGTGAVDFSQESVLLGFDVCDGTSTREEILLLLGAPTAEFERSRLIVHRLCMGASRKLQPFLIGTDVLLLSDRRLFDLVLVYENDVVTRHTLVRVR